jgi:hypothetical protein
LSNCTFKKPKLGKSFVRKNGAGGDGGVECYWILEDNSEYCWQVKYFIDKFSSSQWSQIDDSYKTALEKHPKMNRYYICLPFDKSDSRSLGQNGKPVVTQESKWIKHVEKWQKYAKEKERDIEILFWGKHQINFFLTNGNPEYMGRALYWFNIPSLKFDKFLEISKKSQKSLGDRYTPELNVELPISKQFDGLCLTPYWWEILEEEKTKFKKGYEELFLSLRKEREFISKKINFEEINSFDRLINEFINQINEEIAYKNFKDNLTIALSQITNIKEIYNKIYFKLLNRNSLEKIDDNNRINLNKFQKSIEKFAFFIKRKSSLCGKKAVLLSGSAGIGKSHLLCDLSLNRLKKGLPTLFLLGAQYCGGNPIDFIKNSLDLSNFGDSQVLGILDSIGETYKSRLLVVIDAINEGQNKRDWNNHLNGFLCDLLKYPHIAIIISCRTTFIEYTIPPTVKEQLFQIEHTGFNDYEHRAAEKFLSLQGIDKPSAPILAPEFSNPLFLKICCKVIKQNGKHSFPKGLNGMMSLFDYYISNIEEIVSIRKNYDSRSQRVKKSLKGFALKMLIDDKMEGLLEDEARNLINKNDPNTSFDISLFDILIDEGVLSDDISYNLEQEGELVYRFTYERFSDYFIALELVDKIENIENVFIDNSYCKKIIGNNGYYSKPGIFEALEIIIAEKYKKELRDLVPPSIRINKWNLDEAFKNSILWRSPSSITDRTLEILNNLNHNYFNNPAFDILLKLSTEPDHPWNAEFLHRFLMKYKISDRDSFWSTYVALEDSSEEFEGAESTVRTIIEWAHVCELKDIESERIRLCSIVLIWYLTTSNRRLRDRATKSLVRILCYHPELIIDLINKFAEVDDTYLTERLYSVVYGVVCNIDNKSIIKEIAINIYNLLFSKGNPIPHVLIRDYARGILEYALYLEILPSNISPKTFRPPYQSNENIKNISIQEIEQLEGVDISSSIKSSLMGFPGDFGNYTMGCVHKWSSTPISSGKSETSLEVKEFFCNQFLYGELKKEYKDSLTIEKEEYDDFLLKNIVEENEDDDSNNEKSDLLVKKILEAYENEDINNGNLDSLLKTIRKAIKNKDSNNENVDSISENIIEVTENDDSDNGTIVNENESLDDRVKAQLTKDQKEYYRWLSGLSDNRAASFSRKWAQRWVCKRAYEFGWEKEKFLSFEKNCSYGRGNGSTVQSMERIGKKYQWMAFYEFLARLSDNYYMIDSDYGDDVKKYEGPWQISLRNIDPTIWIRDCRDFFTYNKKTPTWWQPYSFLLPKEDNLEIKRKFLW